MLLQVVAPASARGRAPSSGQDHNDAIPDWSSWFDSFTCIHLLNKSVQQTMIDSRTKKFDLFVAISYTESTVQLWATQLPEALQSNRFGFSHTFSLLFFFSAAFAASPKAVGTEKGFNGQTGPTIVPCILISAVRVDSALVLPITLKWLVYNSCSLMPAVAEAGEPKSGIKHIMSNFAKL